MQEQFWRAIVDCDPSYDGVFYYGVKTTGIFCRPSCKSKTPKKEHVRIFANREEALSALFRPCKRCRPDQLEKPDQELARYIKKWIDDHYQEQLTLSVLADALHISQYHLHRLFKRVTGKTPAQYLQQKRIEKARQLLSQSDMTVSDVAVTVGFLNISHFSTVFQKKVGVTPSAYRNGGPIKNPVSE